MSTAQENHTSVQCTEHLACILPNSLIVALCHVLDLTSCFYDSAGVPRDYLFTYAENISAVLQVETLTQRVPWTKLPKASKLRANQRDKRGVQSQAVE